MALPVISDVYRCAFKWTDTSYGGLAVNVMHFKKSSSNAGAVATIIASHVTSSMWNMQRTTSKIVGIDITPLDGSSLTFPYVTDGTSKWGGATSGSDIMPNVSNIIKIVTAKRGRSYRGRVYLPWLNEGKQTDGKVDSGSQSTVTTAWGTFLAAMSGDSCSLGVASYLHATFEPATAAACETWVATQKRRLTRTSAA